MTNDDKPQRVRGTERAKVLTRARRKYLYVLGGAIVSLLATYGIIQTPEHAAAWLAAWAAVMGMAGTSLKNLSED